MRVAARASRLSVVVHAVEDGGAVCGARPRGDWRLSSLLPVNCPQCLLELVGTRYAYCETMSVPRLVHVREIGAAGFKPRDPIDTRTLCGQVPVWDTNLVRVAPPSSVCVRCRAALDSRRDG
jgi:hypothetical protein